MGSLFTYLLALAMAGATKRTDVQGTEEFGSDSVQFVQVPCDILEAYYFRACRTSRQVSEAFRADWLEKCDVAERAVWVTKFRAGMDTLGRVIQTTFVERDAHWEVSPVLRGPSSSGVPLIGGAELLTVDDARAWRWAHIRPPPPLLYLCGPLQAIQ